MKIHSLDYNLSLPRPIEEVFSFFADARNLEAITPPWLRFRILTPGAIEMAVGTRIRYRLRLRGIPIVWESEITAWEKPVRFVDEQRRGPYRLWRHEHRFAAEDNGTAVADHVDYSVPGGALVHSLFVLPELRKIFDYRQKKIIQLLG